MAVAAAITGGFLAVSSPAVADAATEARSIPGYQVAYDAGLTAAIRAGGGGDDDKIKGKDCKRCQVGPIGPAGPRGRSDGIDSAFAIPTGGVSGKYVGLAQGNGTTLIRDPSSVAPNLFWHDISTVPGYPGNVTDVSLAVTTATPNQLHVTVRSATGAVSHAICLLTPNVTWPGNCGIFINLTPPL